MSGFGYDGDALTDAQKRVNDWREFADWLIGWAYPESVPDEEMRQDIQERWKAAECTECGAVGDCSETCGTTPPLGSDEPTYIRLGCKDAVKRGCEAFIVIPVGGDIDDIRATLSAHDWTLKEAVFVPVIEPVCSACMLARLRAITDGAQQFPGLPAGVVR